MMGSEGLTGAKVCAKVGGMETAAAVVIVWTALVVAVFLRLAARWLAGFL